MLEYIKKSIANYNDVEYVYIHTTYNYILVPRCHYIPVCLYRITVAVHSSESDRSLAINVLDTMPNINVSIINAISQFFVVKQKNNK